MANLDVNPAALRGAVDLSGLVNRANAQAAAQATGATNGSGAAGAGAGAPTGAAAQAAAGQPGGAGAAGAAIELPGLVFDGTDENFTQFLDLSAQVPVIVDLWAEWCQPCKQLSPILDKLVAEFGGRFVLVKVDVDQNPQLTQAFQAQSIPTVAAVIGGRPLQLFQGAIPETQVRQVFEQVLEAAAQSGVSGSVTVVGGAAGDTDAAAAAPEEPPLPPLHQEAYDAIDQGDYPAAIRAYEKAIAQNPTDKMAHAGLAQVSLLDRLNGKTLDEIRSAAAQNPDDLGAQLDVADLDLSGGHVEDAFDRLLTLFPEQDADGKNTIRARLLQLFEVVGLDDPRVAVARGRLTNLLF
jgi:putative thioredoxin